MSEFKLLPENALKSDRTGLSDMTSFLHTIKLSGQSLDSALTQCMLAMKTRLGFTSAQLYCHYKFTRNIELAATSDEQLPLYDVQLISSIIQAGEILSATDARGEVTVALPLPALQNRRFLEGDDKAGDFNTNWGVLIVTSTTPLSPHSESLLRFIALEINCIFEMHEMLQYERGMSSCLAESRKIGEMPFPSSDIFQLFTNWSSTNTVDRLFDGMIIRLKSGICEPLDGICHSTIKVLPAELDDFLCKEECREPQELYDIAIKGYHSAILYPLVNKGTFLGTVGFFKSYRRILRPEERGAAQVIAEHISSNLLNILVQKQLEEQKNELARNEYFSTIGKMASWIAHEVRNPIFVISTIAKILLKQARDSEQEKFISSILNETKSLNNLIEDLLIYGKPLELKVEKVIITKAIAEIAGGMEPFIAESGGIVEIESADNEIVAEIDKERLKQVLYNLIKNSLEAGATKTIIKIRPDKKCALITISDDGKGIKPSNIDKMFIPFISTKKGGSGLGLSICKKIVEEHGGHIQIANEVEKGVRVQIDFPMADYG